MAPFDPYSEDGLVRNAGKLNSCKTSHLSLREESVKCLRQLPVEHHTQTDRDTLYAEHAFRILVLQNLSTMDNSHSVVLPSMIRYH